MACSAPFRLNRSGLLLVLISAAFAGQADAAAGRVDFAVGSATVVGTDGRSRPVARGTELDTGDTVRTTDGRVQVRMTDGAFISLQPNTEFGIKNYRFEGKTDGTESAFYSLVKGAMRTVTGFIGRVNRDKYRVATPTATVGIRGTGGLIQVLLDGSTLVHGTSGIWFLANPSGSIDIPAGVSGLAPSDPNQPPTETSDVPTAGPTPPTAQREYVQGDEREMNGEPAIGVLPPPPTAQVLQSGSGYTGTMAYSWFSSPQISITPDATATFDAAGRLTAITDSIGQNFSSDGTPFSDFGNDGIIAWGRWTGRVTGLANIDGLLTVDETYNANQGFHYVVGMPTASMPLLGSATYTLLGATRPTYIDGSTAPGTFSGSLNVDFTALTVGMNLNVAMPDGRGYGVGGTAQIAGNIILGSSGNGLTTSGTGGACTSGCNALVSGFFAGTSAERAGLGYHINDFVTGKDVIGAAAFKK
jgi:hypothetical protein